MKEHKNADRFTGFADIYESARPQMPEYPIMVIYNGPINPDHS